MSISTHRIRVAVAIAASLAFLWMLASSSVGAQSAAELSEQEKRGKQIYLKGESDAGQIMAVLGSSDLELPAASFPCANCHGLKGEGTQEGGLAPPPINWAALTSPQRSPLTGRDRPAYDEATLARSIMMGVDPAGARLHPGMPHYKMKPEQMADLIAYLKKIGKASDSDPGVSDEAIRVGVALPMTGPMASVGEDAKSALAAYFNEVNAQGGIYNRKFELVVEDSRGDSAGTLEATRRLVERHGVFALVASFEPQDSQPINEYLKESEVPLVGPITLSPRLPAVPNLYVFYLLPSFNDQARVLVDFAAMRSADVKGRPLRLAVVHTGTEYDLDALEGMKSQARLHAAELVAEQPYEVGKFSARAVAAALKAKKPDHIFFFGLPADFSAFAAEMERVKLEAGLLSSSVMVGRAAFSLPPAVAARTYLSYPSSLPSEGEFKEFISVMQRSGVALRSAAFQAVAFAAAKVFVEATKNSSRRLSRSALVESLERLHNFRTGVLPPVSFGPNRRVGATGSYVVGIDLNAKQYAPLSDRLIPKSVP